MNNELVIGKMIEYYLEKYNMTRKALGEKLGKSESAVSKWISGASTPMAKDLSTMTFLFETDIQTLMYGANESAEVPADNRMTIAAHIDSDVSDEEMEDIINYIEFIKNKHSKKEG